MSTFITILVFILIFSILILIHELGHFFMAKRMGIKVEEFGFGLPPRIWGKKIGETIYSINCFPFGGFVRLYGEDAHETGVLKDKKSFAGKSLRQRIGVVVAGVFMNFLLAILLLTFGFTFGIQPLLVTHNDLFSAIDTGLVEISPGVKIKNVIPASVAEVIGFKPGDIIVQVHGDSVFDFEDFQRLLKMPPKSDIQLKVLREPFFLELTLPGSDSRSGVISDEGFGLEFYDVFFLPRLTFARESPESLFGRSGLQEGDVLLKINNQDIYNFSDYQDAIAIAKKIDFTVLRDYRVMHFDIPFQDSSVVVAEVLAGGNAEKAGLKKGDFIFQVQRFNVSRPQDVIDFLAESEGSQIQFLVEREGNPVTLFLTPDKQRKIGVILAPLIRQTPQSHMYVSSISTSILKIHDVQYPFFQAFLQSLRESYRLASATISMFGNLISDVVSQLEVPEGVSGPVGIAQMTGVFVREGFFSLVRFTALLSLSLAVMNLLPFPGLDGGRLLFLIVEGVRGKGLPARFEHIVHTLGFVLLLILILAVTYKDIFRLVMD